MKRLYVRKACRGRGIGMALIEWLFEQAREAGYAEMCLDTMPSMQSAMAVYERLGLRGAHRTSQRRHPARCASG